MTKEITKEDIGVLNTLSKLKRVKNAITELENSLNELTSTDEEMCFHDKIRALLENEGYSDVFIKEKTEGNDPNKYRIIKIEAMR